MISTISLVVSVLALGVSGLTAWFTLLRRGKIKMTRPTVIFFGPDGSSNSTSPKWKVFLRTLLYATSKRGRIIESMYVRVRRGEATQNFNIWTYGEKGSLVRGSGLFIPETGVATNHHFLLPADCTSFQFSSGDYIVEVFASLVGDRVAHLLYSIKLEVTSQQAAAIKDDDHGLYFDWGPDSAKYHPFLDGGHRPELPEPLRDFIGF